MQVSCRYSERGSREKGIPGGAEVRSGGEMPISVNDLVVNDIIIVMLL